MDGHVGVGDPHRKTIDDKDMSFFFFFFFFWEGGEGETWCWEERELEEN